MQFSTFLLNPDFSPAPSLTPLHVERLEWRLPGGAQTAVLRGETTLPADADALQSYLRRPVEIRTPSGELCWWGYVHTVRAVQYGWQVTQTLQGFANRVAVVYSYQPPGTTRLGQRLITPWAEDSASIQRYGIRELLYPALGLTAESAAAKRDSLLAALKQPQSRLHPAPADAPPLRLICRGWWNTLAWHYYANPPTTAISYAASSAEEQPVGSSASNSKLMQQVQVGASAVNALQVAVIARKAGSPADNLTLALYTLSAEGNPTGAALASGSIAGGLVPGSLGWVTVTLSAGRELAANTLYALQVSRTGAVNASNYYIVNANSALGYSPGVMRIWNGSAWVSRSPNADLPFRILADNRIQTTTQLADLVQSAGQFLNGVEPYTPSDVFTSSYRDGLSTALAEAEDLLSVGGANGRQLWAAVTPQRRVRVWEEPAPAAALTLEPDGSLTRILGTPEPCLTPPLGQYLRLRPFSEVHFLQGASYSPAAGWQYQLRGQPAAASSEEEE